MSKKLNIAVIGVGYLGNFHCEKYAQHPSVELVSVVDIQEERAKEISERHRHRYEVNPKFIPKLEEKGLVKYVGRVMLFESINRLESELF